MGRAEDHLFKIWGDLFMQRRCLLFTQIQVTLPAQSLTQRKDLKGHSMFNWHFDDISLAWLTFGGFRFLFFYFHYILSMQKIFSNKNYKFHSHRQSICTGKRRHMHK